MGCVQNLNLLLIIIFTQRFYKRWSLYKEIMQHLRDVKVKHTRCQMIVIRLGGPEHPWTFGGPLRYLGTNIFWIQLGIIMSDFVMCRVIRKLYIKINRASQLLMCDIFLKPRENNSWGVSWGKDLLASKKMFLMSSYQFSTDVRCNDAQKKQLTISLWNRALAPLCSPIKLSGQVAFSTWSNYIMIRMPKVNRCVKFWYHLI